MQKLQDCRSAGLQKVKRPEVGLKGKGRKSRMAELEWLMHPAPAWTKSPKTSRSERSDSQ